MSSRIAGLKVAQTLPGSFMAEHRSEVQAALMRVVDSGRYILGDEVKLFEEEFARRFGYADAIGVANGTDAIALALRALHIGAGDRVATVAHTAVATVAAIQMAGAEPVLVDVTPDTLTLDPTSLERTLRSAGPVKAVIAVHIYGHPADMPAIHKVARACGAIVIEDCSQAHGATLNGSNVGTMSEAGTFSFYPTKNLGALGDGGMVVSQNPEVARRVRSLREYGWEQRYISECPGVNSRLDELQAAVLRLGLAHLDAGNARRREIAAKYQKALAETGLMLPFESEGAHHVFHQYVVRHPKRDQLRDELCKRGIASNIHYPVPVHMQPAYRSRCITDPDGLRVTEAVSSEILSLPMYPAMSHDEVEAVVQGVRASMEYLG